MIDQRAARIWRSLSHDERVRRLSDAADHAAEKRQMHRTMTEIALEKIAEELADKPAIAEPVLPPFHAAEPEDEDDDADE